MMFDLMALAYEADLTRVFTFMMNREASQLVFPNLGINEPWHHVSHHGNEPGQARAARQAEHVADQPVRQVPRPPAVDARRRRHAARSFADPVGQRHERQQRALAARRAVPDGRQRRRAVQGRPAPRRAKGTQLANVMLTVAQKFGAEIDRFGVSTGAFEL